VFQILAFLSRSGSFIPKFSVRDLDPDPTISTNVDVNGFKLQYCELLKIWLTRQFCQQQKNWEVYRSGVIRIRKMLIIKINVSCRLFTGNVPAHFSGSVPILYILNSQQNSPYVGNFKNVLFIYAQSSNKISVYVVLFWRLYSWNNFKENYSINLHEKKTNRFQTHSKNSRFSSE